ncbi:hypothetical protein OIO90_004216 [Microbotryomycetes sp. JL221]|nr:hypothetical protein OIO90_004216 [Microbotryomycetes sp. JL221]
MAPDRVLDVESSSNEPQQRTRPDGFRARIASRLIDSELDLDACLYPLAGYCLLTGLTSAPVFSACYIWPGFQTGNTVQLSIAIARLFAAQPRDLSFEPPDQQALCSLLGFLLGACFGRLGDRWGAQQRSWVFCATFLQALLLMAAALCIHASNEPSIATDRSNVAWHSVLGMATIAFASASLGLHGFVAKRIKSEFGTSVVLTTVFVELVTDPKLFSLKPVKTRDHRVLAIVGLFLGGLFGAALTHTIGAAGTFGVAAGVRVVSAISWGFVPGRKREA